MGASSSTRLIEDGTSLSPLVSGSAANGSGELSGQRDYVIASPLVWIWIGLLTIAGYAGVFPQLSKLWEIWTTDPLRSIGILILPTSVFLIVYAWRQSNWELRGSWWGLLPVVLAFAPIISARRLEFFWIHGDFKLNFIPSVFPIFLYTGGVV